MNEITQMDIVKEFFAQNPNRKIATPEIVDWVTKEYQKRTGKIFRDPDRQIRTLAQKGFLIKHEQGVYEYDPEHVENRELEDFTEAQKKIILERDGYKCAICGLGIKDGVTLHVDHIKPKDLGGKATLENGQILCSKHNFIKKNFKQTETGKKLFINLYNLSKTEDNKELMEFASEILQVFEKHNMNGHIEWKK